MSKQMTKSRSLVLVTFAYVAAIAVATEWLAWGPSTGRLWLDTLVADVVATLVVFAFSRAYGNSSFYDAYWSVIPPLLTGYWWSQSGSTYLRCWLVMALVMLAFSMFIDWLVINLLLGCCEGGVCWPDIYPQCRNQSQEASHGQEN